MEIVIDAKPRQETMTIAYEKGEQVITHPTGVVQTLTVKDLEDRKTILLADKARIEADIVAVDNSIVECEKTI